MKKFMNELKNKRYTISLLVTVLGLIGLISGTSYAILKGSTSASSVQIIKSGSVELKLTENFDNIDAGASTMSDVDGLLQDDVYNFTISNIGTVSAKYDLKLVNEAPSGQTALSDEYVRVGLEVNGQEMGPMGLTNVNNIIDSTTIEDGEIVRYKLRVWFDESKTSELTGTTNKVYLKLKIEAKQAEYKEQEYNPEPGATVLYSDGTLIINEPSSQRQTNITKHGAVSKEYAEMKSEGTDIEKYIFTSAIQRPWNGDTSSITKVEIGQKIRPTSTAHWFDWFSYMAAGNFTNLDTRNVTDMQYMFSKAGQDVTITSFILTGLDDWNTSKVTNMSGMFEYTGQNANIWNIGNLSNWNTSKVTNMSSMFKSAGQNASTWNSIGPFNIYATSIDEMFRECIKTTATLNIYSNPASYSNAFAGAAYDYSTSPLITVNYSSTTTNIDSIVATGAGGNVVKGSLLS